MKQSVTLILIMLLQANLIAQNSFKIILGDETTPTLGYNLFVTENNNIIVPGLKINYSDNDTIYAGYLWKISETGNIILENDTILNDTSIIQKAIVKAENERFWTYSILYKGGDPGTIYNYLLSEYDYDFNLIIKKEIVLPDSLFYSTWLTQRTRLRYSNETIIWSDMMKNKHSYNNGYYDSHSFFYVFDANGDSLNFKTEEKFLKFFDVKFINSETIYTTELKNSIISTVKKRNLNTLEVESEFNSTNLPDLYWETFSEKETYFEFITDTSFVYLGIDLLSQPYITILDTAFNVLKYAHYGGSFEAYSARNNGLAISSDGYIYTVHSRGIATEYMLTKLDTDLNVIWERFFLSKGDFLYDIKPSMDGGCVILGNTVVNQKYHILLLKVDENGNISNIEDNKKILHELIIYPNPGNAQLNIRTAVQRIGGEFKMFDISGKLIFQKHIKESITTINTAHLPSGAYIYNYTHEGDVIESGKWVKQ